VHGKFSRILGEIKQQRTKSRQEEPPRG
jgi:hypothetical protein